MACKVLLGFASRLIGDVLLQNPIAPDSLEALWELLLLLEVDESSDDEELEESPLLEESKSSEEDVGFLLLLFFSPGLAAALPLSASLGSSSEAPRKRGLYCMLAEFVQTGNMNHMPAASNALCSTVWQQLHSSRGA